jgi:predicted TIM-barrel fold metal-dependent hydrolase
MHVVDLEYPLSSPAYKPHAASLSDALTAESSLGISNLVFVQPSIYGNDNSCLLEAMESLGPQHARGVVAFDPATISKDELHRWHHIGVRGVRVNLMSTGKTPSSKELSDLLWAYAEVIRPLDWVLQLYLDMENLPSLEDTIPNLGVKVCLDHFASPWIPPNSKSRAPIDPYDLEGFDSLMSLLRQGNTYVKFSAAYRLSPDPNSKDVEAIAREILRVAHGRAVFATDWPHTRFDGLDIAPYVQQCLDWCDGNSKRVERVFRKNAEELWDVQS